MTLEDARVLVTGGAGFIGSEVVKQLVELGSYVTILDNFSSGKQEYIVNSEKVKVRPMPVKNAVLHILFRSGMTGNVRAVLESVRGDKGNLKDINISTFDEFIENLKI